MKIRIMSDVHNEFGLLEVPYVDNEEDMILVLAGDIGVASKTHTYVDFLTDMNDRFKHVIYVAGNHEHYHGKFPTTLAMLRENCKHLTRVLVMDKESVVIDNVAFICATLWTNFNKGDPITMWDSKQAMRDYKLIRTGPKSEPWRKKFEPLDAYTDFMEATAFIFNDIDKQKKLGHQVVVVTHHAPSFESVANKYRDDTTTGAYASDLQDEIIETKPNIWVHGHMHNSSDYTIGDTRIVANPRGYVGYDCNDDFDSKMVLEL